MRAGSARARHCDNASLHGNAPNPSSRTASTSACWARCGSTRPRVSTRARCRRSVRRARRPARACPHPAHPRRLRGNARRIPRAASSSSTGAPRSSKASFASKRSSPATIHGSPCRGPNRRTGAACGRWRLVALRVARMLPGDAIRERVREQVAEFVRRRIGRRRGIAAQATPPLLRGRVDRGQRRNGSRRSQRVRRGTRPTRSSVRRWRRCGCAADRAPRPARRDRRPARRGADRSSPAASRPGADACQREHLPAARGDVGGSLSACGGGRSIHQPHQQVASGGERARWRRIDEAQCGTAPGRELQRQRRESTARFRGAVAVPAVAIAATAGTPAIGDAAGAAGALVGGGLRNGGDLESREPLFGSKRGSRASPLSITTRTPGRVTLDSATLVASTTRRRPSPAGCSTRDCCSTGNSPCRARTSISLSRPSATPLPRRGKA